MNWEELPNIAIIKQDVTKQSLMLCVLAIPLYSSIETSGLMMIFQKLPVNKRQSKLIGYIGLLYEVVQ